MCVNTSYTYKGKVKDPRYMQNKKDSRISLEKGLWFRVLIYFECMGSKTKMSSEIYLPLSQEIAGIKLHSGVQFFKRLLIKKIYILFGAEFVQLVKKKLSDTFPPFSAVLSSFFFDVMSINIWKSKCEFRMTFPPLWSAAWILTTYCI